MKLQVMAVLDLKAHAFSNPFYIAHEDLAVRAFVEAARTPGNSIYKYPEEHQLYHLGEFDDNSGRFTMLPQPVLVFAGNQLAVPPRANAEA